MFGHSSQDIAHIRECHGDSNQYTLCRGEIDNTRYVCSLRPYVWQPFTTTIKESIQAHLTLVHVFDTIVSMGNPWVAHTLSRFASTDHHCRYVGVSSNSVTISATQFMRPHKSRIRQYIINACTSGPNRRGP
jgi:hypothetical protein